MRRTWKAALGLTLGVLGFTAYAVTQGYQVEGLAPSIVTGTTLIAALIGSHIVREDARKERRRRD